MCAARTGFVALVTRRRSDYEYNVLMASPLNYNFFNWTIYPLFYWTIRGSLENSREKHNMLCIKTRKKTNHLWVPSSDATRGLWGCKPPEKIRCVLCFYPWLYSFCPKQRLPCWVLRNSPLKSIHFGFATGSKWRHVNATNICCGSIY